MQKYPAYKDSGVEWLGEIPNHWEVKKVTHVFNKIGSGTTPTAGALKYYDNGQINWLQTGDLNDGLIDDTNKKITKKAIRALIIIVIKIIKNCKTKTSNCKKKELGKIKIKIEVNSINKNVVISIKQNIVGISKRFSGCN
jgi:hypothetical protein